MVEHHIIGRAGGRSADRDAIPHARRDPFDRVSGANGDVLDQHIVSFNAYATAGDGDSWLWRGVTSYCDVRVADAEH